MKSRLTNIPEVGLATLLLSSQALAWGGAKKDRDIGKKDQNQSATYKKSDTDRDYSADKDMNKPDRDLSQSKNLDKTLNQLCARSPSRRLSTR